MRPRLIGLPIRDGEDGRDTREAGNRVGSSVPKLWGAARFGSTPSDADGVLVAKRTEA